MVQERKTGVGFVWWVELDVGLVKADESRSLSSGYDVVLKH